MVDLNDTLDTMTRIALILRRRGGTCS